MFPVLFKIGIPVDTYYVIWLIALFLALRWTISRMSFYGIDDDEGRRVLSWGFLGMLAGSRAAEYVWNFPSYLETPSLIFDLNRGGLSEKGAMCGALFVVFLLCRRNTKVSFFSMCEAAVLPAFAAIALGRWGCLAAGCCVGVESSLPFALHFPYDASSITRHPTQIYYSLCAAVALLSLLLLEKHAVRRGDGQRPPRPLLTPLGLIFYSIMRLSIDPFRLSGFPASDVALAVLIPFEAAWFWTSWRVLRSIKAVDFAHSVD